MYVINVHVMHIQYGLTDLKDRMNIYSQHLHSIEAVSNNSIAVYVSR